jgi:MFS family permease
MFQALRNRNVALLFSAQVVSIAGDLVLFVALPFWVFQLTGSAMATGFMFAALTIPQLLFSPIAGVFVDRLDRKKLMITSDLIRAALMLCYLFVNTPEQVWIIYVLAFLESAVSQFFRPAVMAVVPNLVKDEQELTQANAALGASWAVGQLAGPALGGVLVASFGPHGAALFDAATYVLAGLIVLLIHVPKRESNVPHLNDVRQAMDQITREMLDGVRVVLNRPILRVVFAALGILFLSQGIINVLLIVIVNQLWHVGATEFGWFVSMEGVGGLIGTVIVGALASKIVPKRLVIGGGVLAGFILLILVNQGNFYLALALMPIASIGIVAFDVGLTTLLQIGSDDANRGRVSSLMHTVMAAAQLLSIGATSLLADQVGAIVMLNIAAVLFALGGLVAILAPRETDSVQAIPSNAQPAE